MRTSCITRTRGEGGGKYGVIRKIGGRGTRNDRCHRLKRKSDQYIKNSRIVSKGAELKSANLDAGMGNQIFNCCGRTCARSTLESNGWIEMSLVVPPHQTWWSSIWSDLSNRRAKNINFCWRKWAQDLLILHLYGFYRGDWLLLCTLN